MITETVSWLEAIFTLLAIVGLILKGGLFIRSVGEARVLGQDIPPDNPLRIITRIKIRSNGVRCLWQLGFIVIGVIFMVRPNNPNAEASLAATLIAVTILLMEGVLIWVAVKEYLDYNRLYSMMDAFQVVPINREEDRHGL